MTHFASRISLAVILAVLCVTRPAAADITYDDQANFLESWVTGYTPAERFGDTSTAQRSNEVIGSFSAAMTFDNRVGTLDHTHDATLNDDISATPTLIDLNAQSTITTGPVSDPFYAYEWSSEDGFAVSFNLTEAIDVELDYAVQFTGGGLSYGSLEDLNGDTLWESPDTGDVNLGPTLLQLEPGDYRLALGIVHGGVLNHGSTAGSYTFSMTTVPEPGSIALTSVGLGTLLFVRRRKAYSFQ